MRQRLPPLVRSLYARGASRLARLHAVFMDDVKPSWRVLDLGSGPGHHAALLHARVLDVVGLDVDPWMVVRAAGSHEGPAFQVGDAAAIPYPSKTFDLVWCSGAFHHFADQDAALQESRRVLRRGGEMWIIEGRADLHRQDFRQAYGIPALPGLFAACRALTRRHGATDTRFDAVADDMKALGFRVDVDRRGAFARIRGRL